MAALKTAVERIRANDTALLKLKYFWTVLFPSACVAQSLQQSKWRMRVMYWAR